MIERFGKMDKMIFVLSLIMMGFGIVFVYSSSFAIAQQKFGGADFFLARHLVRAGLGLLCFFAFLALDYHTLSKYGTILYGCAIALLLYTLMLPESHAINGAKRWATIGIFQFQVSEFARIALIIALAMHLEKQGDRIRERSVFLQNLVKIALVCGLILVEPNFSTALLIGFVGLSMLYVAGAKLFHIAGIACALLPAAIVAVITTPYRYKRLLGYLHMSDTKEGISYQIFQSLIGLGHGGIFGVGLGQGEQKYFYLPEPHTDFVFSILGEEMGFIGLMAVLAVFAMLLYRGMCVALRAPDTMGRLMAFGLTLVLGMYVVIHALVNTGLIPTTGVPMPFFSYGGMSLIFTMSSMGILLNISSQGSAMERVPGKSRRI
jgi:cell division protein FtsW